MTQQHKEELSRQIHNEALSFSSSSKKLGELTVIPVGYVSQIALKFIDTILAEKVEKIKERRKHVNIFSSETGDKFVDDVITILKQ